MLPKYLSSSHRVRSYRYLLLVALIAAAAFLCLHVAPWRVRAATVTVTNTNDSGAGSLRAAIAVAASGDTINFNLSGCPCTITLTTGELNINKNLTIQGPGARLLTVSGGNASRVFSVNAGVTATLNGLTVSGGRTNSAVGGGILNQGALTISSAIIAGNSAPFNNNGGGIYNEGTLSISNSTLAGNSCGDRGGAVYNKAGGTLTISNSTMSGNQTSGSTGGAIMNFGTLTLTNSTLTNNRAGNFGGGIDNGGNATLQNTIVAGNFGSTSSPSDFIGAINVAFYNLIGTSGFGSGNITHGMNGNIVGNSGVGTININTVLNTTLADNGGPTPTHALVLGSPAIDKGKSFTAATTDQRGTGFPRTVDDANISNASGGDGTDMGAFESKYLVVNTTAQDDDGSCLPLAVGDCTLREAIVGANANPGTESILFDIPTTDTGYDSVADLYTIRLTSVLPNLNSDMDIAGLGANRLRLLRDSASAFRIFAVDIGKTVAISGLTISGGHPDLSDAFGRGAGIYNSGTLNLSDSTLSNNSNAGDGAGIFNVGTLNVRNSTFAVNVSGNAGGGIANNAGTLTVTGSTFSGNSGGGINNFNFGTLTVSNSTFSGNISSFSGGAIANFGQSTATVNSSTIANNSARFGGGISTNSTFTVNNSIVANNSGTPTDIDGSVTGVHNLIRNGTGSAGLTNGINGNQVGTAASPIDPRLGPLADNGGPTKTRALFCGSPAIDKGKNFVGTATDQRGGGFVRTFDDPAVANALPADPTDIGAFEAQTHVNCAPTAVADSYSTDEDTPLSDSDPGVLGNDSDPDTGDSITAVLVTGPANAASFAFNANGSFNYTPNSNFNGSDSFTYKARDNHNADSNTVTVAITVTPVNDLPTAGDDNANTNEDTPVAIIVLANDSDIDGDTVTVSNVTQPAHGGAAINPDGTITYSPNANFNGSDSFTYDVDDGHGGSATATVQINVAPVNDAPVAANDSYSTNEDTSLSVGAPGVRSNDGDVDGDAISAVLVSGPSHGSVIFSGNGSFNYTPAANYNGPDSFTYKVNDGSLDSNVATVSITVNAVNDAPTVVVTPGGSCFDAPSVSGSMNLTVGDVESPPGTLTLSGSSNNTALVPNSNIVFGGSGANRTITITAAPKKTGTATITVLVSDGQATGMVTITVIVGSDKNETLNGTAGADMIFGLGGKNTINGNAGNDLICGGNGVDTISGGDGDDTIDGGNGDDVLRGDAGNDILRGETGNDRLEGGGDNDTLTGGLGADFFSGGPGVDSVTDLTPGQGDTQNGIP